MMYSLGHAGSAMKSSALIAIPGVFVNKSGERRLRAVLNCSFSVKHDFNLLSMSRLLHKKGWKMVCDNESLIHTENRKREVIDFDIVMPTEKLHICTYCGDYDS